MLTMLFVLFILNVVEGVIGESESTAFVAVVNQLHQSMHQLQNLNDESLLLVEAQKVIGVSVQNILDSHPDLESNPDLLVDSISSVLTEAFRCVNDDMFAWVHAGDGVIIEVQKILTKKDYKVDDIVSVFLSSSEFLEMVMQGLMEGSIYIEQGYNYKEDSSPYSHTH